MQKTPGNARLPWAGAAVAAGLAAFVAIESRSRDPLVAFACLAAAYAVFLRAGVTPDYPGVLLPTMLLVGLAFGLGFSALSVAAIDGLPDGEQGLAASLFQTSFQVGGALVLAVVTAVGDAGGGGQLARPAATLAAYRPALFLITGVAATGALVAIAGLRRGTAVVSAAPAAVPD